MIKRIRIICALAVAFSLSNFAIAQQQHKIATPRFEIPSEAKDGIDYMSRTIIFKVNPMYRALCTATSINHSGLNALIQQLGLSSFSKIYPRAQPPEKAVNQYGQKLVDLSLIYQYKYTSNVSLQEALDKFAGLGICTYAEPHFLPKAYFTPNDPSLSVQYNIVKINAEAAWNISTGDTNVVIGIVDTGTEPTHPDLAGNIKHNYFKSITNPGDTIDGIDNDGDGYIDNFSGWDLGMNDNDPTWQGDAHGVHVSGIADAVTNNAVGIAGVGYKCKFLPVKIADATGVLVASYEGIQYAADHGCKVINCSWGGSGGGSYGQDIINYATFNMDALVVAAAGNNGNSVAEYPGYFDNVLSVAATTSTDARASYSNYGNWVKICAPGDNVYSTYSLSQGSYAYLSGTSMASPCTAGAAAMVRSFFPSYNALQTAARLQVTADTSIYSPSVNLATMKNMLGTGRVNLYRALNDPGSPSVSMTTRNITVGASGIGAPVAGDTLFIGGIFTDFLSPTTNLTATLTTPSTYVTILPATSVATLGAIPTMGTATNSGSPYKVVIKKTAPLNTNITFQISYRDGSYKSKEFFTVVVNVDYLNVTVNAITTSVTSKGIIGWNDSPPTQGLGFNYNGTYMEYDGGLMIGVPDSAVSNVIRGLSVNNQDFVSKVNIKQIVAGALSDFDTDGSFTDAAAAQQLPVLVHHRSYAWSDPADSKYVMYRYVVHNTGTAALNALYIGIIMDWDLQDPNGANNKASYDATNRMGYAWNDSVLNPIYAGIKLLSHTTGVSTYAFDNTKGGSGGINLYDGFTELEKYTSMSTMRTDAGLVGKGNDILDEVSAGPLSLNAGDSIEVAFALLGGDNLADLQNSAINAQTKYDGTVLSVPVIQAAKSIYSMQSFPNPASGNTTINIHLPVTGSIQLKIYDMIGQEVSTLANGYFAEGQHQFSMDASKMNSGVYYCELIAGSTKIVQKLVVSN